MRGGVKRRRWVSSGGCESSSPISQNAERCSATQIQSPLHVSEDDNSFRPDSGHFEVGSFSTRCSLKLIHEVVSRFDEQKRELVRSAGFGGILHFPEIKQINRKFVLWLMSCVDETSRTLVVGEDIRIKFSKIDVATVFGIPCCGRRVMDSGERNPVYKDKVLDEYLGSVFRQDRSIKVLVELIDRRYGYPMSKSEQDSFTVAFVVFIVSTLLCPAAKFDYASVDYWSAISGVDSIASYDWADYVLVRLMQAVAKLKEDVKSSMKYPNIAGCSLFLQVFYLDSLDLGDLSLPHNSFPRVRHFCYDRIRAMISVDKNYQSYLEHSQEPMSSKLRDPCELSYFWAVICHSESEIPRTGSVVAIWEACVTMARLLDVPMEAAGPLFVAASEFQDQVDTGVARSGLHAIKYITVLASIMLAYKGGFCYHFSIDDEEMKDAVAIGSDVISSSVSRGLNLMSFPLRTRRKEVHIGESSGSSSTNSSRVSEACRGATRTLDHCVIGGSVLSSIKVAMESLESMQTDFNVNHRLISVMSKFYSLVRRMKLPVGVDLNGVSAEHISCPYAPIPYMCRSSPKAPPPWQLGNAWTISEVDVADVFARVKRLGEEEGFVIVHRSPKHIQVSARSFRSQIIGKSEIELDLLDAMLRKLKQDDEQFYECSTRQRWRHFFESDFMACITSGLYDLSDSKLIHHFSICNLSYDLSKCKLIFFPALLQYRWVCYVWCLESNVIHVFDPSYSIAKPDPAMESHERICFLLKNAMHQLCRRLYKGWQHDWISADLRLVTWIDRHQLGCNRTGVLCAIFCRCFDGEDLVPTMKSVHTDAIAAKLAEDVLQLKGNIGRVPCYLVN